MFISSNNIVIYSLHYFLETRILIVNRNRFVNFLSTIMKFVIISETRILNKLYVYKFIQYCHLFSGRLSRNQNSCYGNSDLLFRRSQQDNKPPSINDATLFKGEGGWQKSL